MIYSLSTSELIFYGLAAVLFVVSASFFARYVRKKMISQKEERLIGFITDHLLLKWIRGLLIIMCIGVVIAYLLFFFGSFSLFSGFIEHIVSFFHQIVTFIVGVLNRPLFNLGEQGISLRFLFFLIIAFTLLVIITGAFRRYLKKFVLKGLDLEIGVKESLSSIAGYIFLIVASLIVFDLFGIDLSMLAIIFGALSIGIGFGLQHIVNNFISGLILLVERPINVGDRIDLGDVQGEVLKVNARATLVRTNDNIVIYIPNAEFISNRVVNWSQNQKLIRFRVQVGVAYGTDIDLALKVMEEAGESVAEVLKDPKPVARFISFGESSLDLELRVWTIKMLHTRGRIISDLNIAIYKKFIEHDIAIPFPQRDIYIKSWPGNLNH